MARLMNPHDQTPKETHTYTPKTSSQLAPQVPVWEVTQLHLDLHKADQGQNWAAEPSSFWLFFCRSWGCSSCQRGCEIAATFITNICWCNGSWASVCSSYDQSYTDVIFGILVGRGKLFLAFCHFNNEVCFKRGWCRCGLLTESVKNLGTRVIFQSQKYLFLFMSWDQKWNKLSRVHRTCPPLLYCFFNMEESVLNLLSKSKDPLCGLAKENLFLKRPLESLLFLRWGAHRHKAFITSSCTKAGSFLLITGRTICSNAR